MIRALTMPVMSQPRRKKPIPRAVLWRSSHFMSFSAESMFTSLVTQKVPTFIIDSLSPL